jgi:hypothetical protein
MFLHVHDPHQLNRKISRKLNSMWYSNKFVIMHHTPTAPSVVTQLEPGTILIIERLHLHNIEYRVPI